MFAFVYLTLSKASVEGNNEKTTIGSKAGGGTSITVAFIQCETEAMDVDAPPASEVDISPERLEAFKAALGRYRYAQHIEQISIADIEGIVHRREPVPYSTAEIMSLLELSTDNARERQLNVGQEYECSVLI